MSQETMTAYEIATKRLVYSMSGTDAVTVREDVVYRASDAGSVTMDLYYPADSTPATLLPAVVMVAGYSSVRVPPLLDVKFKYFVSATSWARMVAASGMVTILYSNREPVADIHALLEYVREHAASLGIDANRIGLSASSGHSPLALSVLMTGAMAYLKCAVLCYPFMLDDVNSKATSDMAARFGFANPNAGKSVDDLRDNVPLFVVRCGRDQFPGLNGTIDRFMAGAMARNLPVTFVNHAEAPHAFDLFHDSDTSRHLIKDILRFMQFNLCGSL